MTEYVPDDRLARPEGEFTRMQVLTGAAAVRTAPDADAEMATKALCGEVVRLFYEEGGFALVQSEADGYVGWLSRDTLAEPVRPVTHRVTAQRTFVFSEPSIKSRPVCSLSLNAGVPASGESGNGRFLTIEGLGHVVAIHLGAPGEAEDDPAGVALRFVHTPYLWGGRESLGLDCSGLTQMAFAACGVTLPRDTDMQAAWAGAPVENWETTDPLRRGDLVYWKGHVGLMVDAARMVHANAFHMKTVVENLSAARERIDAEYGPPVAVRRVDVDAESGRVPDWLPRVLQDPA